MKKTPGSRLIIQLNDIKILFIAEVVKENPLVLKVRESGSLARIESGQYVIDEALSERIQDPQQSNAVLKEGAASNQPFMSGLASLGIAENTFNDVYSMPDLARRL